MSEDIDIEKLRADRGWSQSDLAEYFGVTQGTVSRWEAKKVRPRGAALRLLKGLQQSEAGGVK